MSVMLAMMEDTTIKKTRNLDAGAPVKPDVSMVVLQTRFDYECNPCRRVMSSEAQTELKVLVSRALSPWSKVVVRLRCSFAGWAEVPAALIVSRCLARQLVALQHRYHYQVSSRKLDSKSSLLLYIGDCNTSRQKTRILQRPPGVADAWP